MQETIYTVKGCPVKIALVTDLHQRPYLEAERSLRRRKPDIICIAGDFVFGSHSGVLLKVEKSAYVLPFLSTCAELAPSFVSFGNHEWLLTPGDLELIGRTGVQLLDNTWVTHETETAKLVIGGLTSAQVSILRRLCVIGKVDPYDMNPKAAKLSHQMPPELGWLSGFVEEPGYHILLSHHPEYYPKYLRELPIELILSGHAHGGQVRLFDQGLFAPGQGLLPRLTSGVHDGRLVISRGLSNTVRVPRVFNPTELVYIQPEA